MEAVKLSSIQNPSLNSINSQINSNVPDSQHYQASQNNVNTQSNQNTSQTTTQTADPLNLYDFKN